MKKLAKVRAVILGIQGTQYKITDNIQRHFESAVHDAVKSKDHENKIPNILGAYEDYTEQRVSPIKAFSDVLGVSEMSLQKEIHANLQDRVYGMAIKHIKHDSKLHAATEKLSGAVRFATLTKLSSDFAQEFYRVSGLRNIHRRDSIFAHEDVDFADKSTMEAYWPVLNYLGYKEGDDLSGVLVVDANRDNLACAKAMGMVTACIGDKNLSPLNGDPIDFEYENVKVLMNEVHNAIREEKGPVSNRPSWNEIDHLKWMVEP